MWHGGHSILLLLEISDRILEKTVIHVDIYRISSVSEDKYVQGEGRKAQKRAIVSATEQVVLTENNKKKNFGHKQYRKEFRATEGQKDSLTKAKRKEVLRSKRKYQKQTKRGQEHRGKQANKRAQRQATAKETQTATAQAAPHTYKEWGWEEGKESESLSRDVKTGV